MRLAVLFAVIALPAVAQEADEGAAAFLDHCAACHGAAAMGDGPMSTLLTVPPPDLTGLAARNDGSFPLAQVVQRIDGTTEVRAHGGAMPVFGLLMDGPSVALLAEDGSEVIVPEGIAHIATWLQEVQQ